jgi:8-oxo-dGTP diphosphatase
VEPTPPSFGTKLPGAEYKPRPGAYALVFDSTGRVAIVHEENDWYLPGGGIEAGETPEQALAREVREECACGVSIARLFGDAIEFLVTRSGRHLEVRARYFHATFLGTPTAHWLTPEEASTLVRRRSDAWAITAARDEG